MLKKWKTEVAKVSVSYFEEMNESANKICASVNKLRCNLHFSLRLADAAEKGLNEDDKIVQNDGVTGSKLRIQKHGESGPTRTIRTLQNINLNKQVSCHISQYIWEILLSN